MSQIYGQKGPHTLPVLPCPPHFEEGAWFLPEASTLWSQFGMEMSSRLDASVRGWKQLASSPWG